MEYIEYIKNFRDPPDEYRPATMWFWNDELKKEEISFQLEEFKKQGICDIFVNAAFGLTVKYLSDEFFCFVKYAVGECKRLGLRYWIYDEFNWPSGNAGGELLRQYPWAAGKILKLESVSCLPGHFSDMIARGKLIAAYAVFGAGEGCIVENITKKVKYEESGNGVTSVYYKNDYCNTITLNYYFSVADPHVLTSCVWYKYAGYEAGYIDTFNEAASKKFIELTHERYKKWVGDEFGKTVRGVFTDEACLADPFSLGENRLPWSDFFTEKFKEINGYDITGHLHGLFALPVTPEQKKARNDYFDTAKKLYLENFIKPMYDWCEQNNLKFTGHFDGEESVTWHLMQSGDLMASLEYMHIPGIDSIVSAHKINDKNFNVAGKLLASVSKYCGRERTLCETYTASGWDLRMPMMKKVANRLVMLGVNMIHYMGAYYSWDGFTKTGYTSYPPTHGYNNTLWGHYKKFGDYLSGMQYLSAKTKPSSKILLMIPLVQAKMRLDLSENIFSYLKHDFSLRYIDELIESTINACLRLHVDLDLISEDASPWLDSRGGMIEYRGDEYKYIIFPAMEHISAQTADMIKRLEAAGAKTIYMNSMPAQIVGEGGFTPQKNAILLQTESPISLDAHIEILKGAIDQSDIMLQMETTGNVLACRRENEDIELFFINNDDTAKNIVSVPYSVRGLECYDPETKSPKNYHIESNRRIYELEPDGMMVGILQKNPQPQNFAGELNASPHAVKTRQILSDGWSFSVLNDNVLPLKYMFYDERKNGYIPVNHCDFPSVYPAYPGMKYKIRSCVKIEGAPKICDSGKPVNLNCEICGVSKIHINGKILDHFVNTRFWGVNNFKADISNMLKEGENSIMIEANLPDWPALHALPFGFLSGCFKVNEDDAVVPVFDEKINPGPIENQGYKYFAGKGIFKNVFVPPADMEYTNVFVSFDNKDILKLSVNGFYVCERMWKPYRADITDHIKKNAENEIALEITTTYADMFGLNAENGLESVEIEYTKDSIG